MHWTRAEIPGKTVIKLVHDGKSILGTQIRTQGLRLSGSSTHTGATFPHANIIRTKQRQMFRSKDRTGLYTMAAEVTATYGGYY